MNRDMVKQYAEMKYAEAQERVEDAKRRVAEAKNAASMRVNMARQHEAEKDMRAAQMMMDAV